MNVVTDVEIRSTRRNVSQTGVKGKVCCHNNSRTVLLSGVPLGWFLRVSIPTAAICFRRASSSSTPLSSNRSLTFAVLLFYTFAKLSFSVFAVIQCSVHARPQDFKVLQWTMLYCFTDNGLSGGLVPWICLAFVKWKTGSSIAMKPLIISIGGVGLWMTKCKNEFSTAKWFLLSPLLFE